MIALALALLVAAGDAGAARPDTTRPVPRCPGGQVLAGPDLRGVLLMTDLLDRLDGVAAATMDGFDVWPMTGDGPVGAQPWLILIDGVPIVTGAFGAADFHLLPVEPSEIERVDYCPGPGLAAGRFAGDGRLEITTARRRGVPGWSGGAEARVGNETGDPGPYRYLPDSAPNVDKIGPDVAGRIGTPGGTLSGRFERRYPSDPASFDRNSRILGAYPAIRYGAAGLHVGHPSVPVRLDAGGSYASDLWYLAAAGRELPVRRVGGHGAVTAGMSLDRLALGARASATGASVDRRPEMPDSVSAGFDPAWREVGATVDLEVRLTREGRALAGGAHVSGTSAWGRGLENGRMGLIRLWLHRSGDPRARWLRRTDLAIVSGADHVGFEGAMVIEHRLPRGGAMSLSVSRDDHVPEEDPGPGFWRARGYAGLDLPRTFYSVIPGVRHGTETSIRLDGSVPVAPGIVLRGSAATRDYRDLTLEGGAFRPDSTAGVTGSVDATGGHDGRLVALLLAAHGGRGRFGWGASYRFEKAVAGDGDFHSAWAVVPDHLARAHARFHPDRSLLLRIALEARSSSTWDAYQAFGGLGYPGGGRYDSRVPATLLVSLEAEKSFLDDRLTLTASARNVLGAVERGHPLGADMALRLWTRVAARL